MRNDKTMMKIAVLLENPIQVGGGFNQALNAITQLHDKAAGRFEVEVFTSIVDNLDYLRRLGVRATYLRYGNPNIFVRVLSRTKIGRKFCSPLEGARAQKIERALIADGVDLAYFVTHSSTPIHFRALNFITTVLDLCHRDNLEFPEVRVDGQFEQREAHFSTCLPKAYAVIVASDQLADKIVARYGVDRERMVAMPFAPSPFLNDAHSAVAANVLAKYNLAPGYFFYPAQFWPHKNHIRILEALAYLAAQEKTRVKEVPRVVFSGGDHGNLEHVNAVARRLGVENQVRYIGFVPVEHMRALYEGATAVVMPTYFGPTNIPPQEAWMLGKPLVYSKHLSEQIGDAAILVDPDSDIEIAEAMLRVRDKSVAEDLAMKGRAQLENLRRERCIAEDELVRKLAQFDGRRRCWG